MSCNLPLMIYLGKVSVVVIDDITVGHPCCGVRHYSEPLKSNHDCFCQGHSARNTICAVEGCEAPCETAHSTCTDPSHRRLETEHKQRDKAMFQLKHCLQEAHNHPEVEDMLEALPELPCADKSEIGNKHIQALFGRRCTNNEQIIIQPYGMIVAQQIFYHSETVPQVLVCWLLTLADLDCSYCHF